MNKLAGSVGANLGDGPAPCTVLKLCGSYGVYARDRKYKGYSTNPIWSKKQGLWTKFSNELYTFSVWIIYNVKGPE